MCIGPRKSKDDDKTDDNFQQSGKVKLEDLMVEAMQKMSLALEIIGPEVTI